MPAPANHPSSISLRSVALLVVAIVGGAGISLQLFLNGRLGQSLGSAELAAAANTTIALLTLVVVAAATGTRGRAVARLRERPVHRRWHWFIGLSGAFVVLAAAFAAPRMGVAMLTVALVCGQMLGSLAVDHFGVSPAGRQPLSAPRVTGAALALVAVVIGTFGAPVAPQPLLLAVVVTAGALTAVQQAALGHLARSTGEPVAAGVINFVVGALALIVIAVGLTGGIAPNGWLSAPPIQWLGGLLGAAIAVVIARLVPRIGVLRVMLALVAGQSLGALALDLVAPGSGGVTAVGLIGVALTMVAVTIGSSGRSARPAAIRAPRPLPA